MGQNRILKSIQFTLELDLKWIKNLITSILTRINIESRQQLNQNTVAQITSFSTNSGLVHFESHVNKSILLDINFTL